MSFGNQIPDKTVLKDVTQKLARSGTQGKITAAVRSGDVTLTGTIAFEHQRRSIIRFASGVSGVRRVIDQLQVAPKKSGWT